jgi:ribosomal protein L33
MRDKIKLESSAGTGHFYTTTKNKRLTCFVLLLNLHRHRIQCGQRMITAP